MCLIQKRRENNFYDIFGLWFHPDVVRIVLKVEVPIDYLV